jgi:hypothetical protein
MAFDNVPTCVHAPVAVEVVDGTTAVLAKHAARVRVVDHHDRAVLLGDGAEIRDRTEVAVHAEHAVGDEELSRAHWNLAEDLPCGADIAMREDFDRGAAQPRPSMMLAWFNSSEMIRPLWKDRDTDSGVGRESL